MTPNEIVDNIYKAYGTNSGILFGIKERSITKKIVEFTVNIMGNEKNALLEENEKLKEDNRILREALAKFRSMYGDTTMKLDTVAKCFYDISTEALNQTK